VGGWLTHVGDFAGCKKNGEGAIEYNCAIPKVQVLCASRINGDAGRLQHYVQRGGCGSDGMGAGDARGLGGGLYPGLEENCTESLGGNGGWRRPFGASECGVKVGRNTTAGVATSCWHGGCADGK
jgi:hypothetical protein